MKNKLNSFFAGVAVLVVVLAYAGAFSLSAETLVSAVPVILVAVVLAAVTFWPARMLWPRVSGIGSMWCNALLHTISVTGLLLCLFYVGNYVGADRNTFHTEQALVERKYTKTRHRTRRVNRRTTARGEPYKVYFAQLRLADDRVTDLEMSREQYGRLRSGNMVEMTVARGLFGVPVIRRDVPLTDVGLSGARSGVSD